MNASFQHMVPSFVELQTDRQRSLQIPYAAFLPWLVVHVRALGLVAMDSWNVVHPIEYIVMGHCITCQRTTFLYVPRGEGGGCINGTASSSHSRAPFCCGGKTVSVRVVNKTEMVWSNHQHVICVGFGSSDPSDQSDRIVVWVMPVKPVQWGFVMK